MVNPFYSHFKPLKQLLTCLFLLLFHVVCLAQASSTYFHELHIEGAPFNKEINILFEDSYGFLWIGTNNGLYRYDGHKVLAYRYDVFDPSSIPNNSINSIFEDEHHNLWIGSESFLVLFDRKQQIFKNYYKNSGPRVLGKSADNNIWAYLRTTGLVKIIPHKNTDSIQFDTHFNYEASKTPLRSGTYVNSFITDRDGKNWLATKDGIFSFGDDYQLISSDFHKNTLAVKKGEGHTLLALSDSTLYVLGYKKGNRSLEILETYSHFMKLANRKVQATSLAINPLDKTVWIGTTDGLFQGSRIRDNYKFQYFEVKKNQKGSLLSRQLNTVLVDSYGSLWIGSLKGINKYNDRNSIFNYQHIKTDDNTENHLASYLFLDDNKTLWLGLNHDGIYKHDLDSHISTKAFGSNLVFNAIKNDFEQKEILISSGGSLIKSKGFENGKLPLKFDTIVTYKKIIKDFLPISPKETWVGLWAGGIDIINSENDLSDFKKRTIHQLTNHNVSVMLQDRNKNIWVGTRGTGLYKIDVLNEQTQQFLPIKGKGLSSNAILSLLEVNDKLWIGTRGGGLNVYNQSNGTFNYYGQNEGLRSKTVSALQKDSNGNIWISTKNGLARFDIKEERFVNFGMEDGVMESEFMFNSSTADTGNNILYYGCADGFYSIDTKKFQKSNAKPKTAITKFIALGGEKDRDAPTEMESKSSSISMFSDKTVELPYHKNNIVIEFSSLDLTAPKKNKYAYMLEGINDFWHYTNASSRNVIYNNLSPSKYTFKVKSTNSDGVWSTNPTELDFNITPPYWKSNLAYLVYFLLFLICMYTSSFLVRRWYKLKKKLVEETVSREKDNEMNRMKMVFFTDISHELRTPLSLILGTIEKVVKEKKFTLNSITSQRIYNNSLRMHRLINQIMDIRKFDEGKFKLHISKNNIVRDIEIIKSAFNDFAKIYDIEYTFLSNKEIITGWYDVDILEKILFNLLSNAFKYTPKKGKITVSIGLTDREGLTLTPAQSKKKTFLKCCVRDNGVGIPKADLGHIFDRYYQATKKYSNQIPGTGIGMELVHKLIERHHGLIQVESEENVFTEFTFYLPINKKAYDKKERIKKRTPLTKNYIHNSEFQVVEEVSSKFDLESNGGKNTKPKILLVEDNDDLRSMLKNELKNDFDIFEAANGKEGFVRCMEEKPQLIICDILMPIEDGISLLKRLKENDETKTIPIFMLTAKSSSETKIKCLSLGADDYIEKPFSLEFVKWKVKNTLLSRKELEAKYSKIITAEPTDVEIDSNDERFIKKLIQIIENSMDDDLLSVEYLASEVGMSRANLYRKLQAINGVTPVNFIKQIRLKRAAQLLKKNKMYVSEVAYMTGFNNQKYFSKCFQKEYGESPTSYAKKFIGSNNNKNNFLMKV